MVIKTDVCDMLNIKYPIVQAPMGPYITTKLCAAVSNAGGLGCVSHTGTLDIIKQQVPELYEEVIKSPVVPPDMIEGPLCRSTLEEMRREKDLTDGPFAVNIRVASEQIDAPYLIDNIIEERKQDSDLERKLTTIISSAGNPALYTERLKKAGLIVVHVVPSVYHALKAERSGCDAVVASGHEAGGHIAWDPVHTSVLLPAVREAVKIPVLSAGGWCNGKGLVAALALGAVAILMGTRFIATKESDFGQGYKEAIVKASERDTVVTAGSLGPMRILKNKFALRLQKVLDSVTGSFQSKFENPEVIKTKTVPYSTSYVYGETDDTPVLTGEVQGVIDDIPTVKELIERIMREAEEIIAKKLPSFVA